MLSLLSSSVADFFFSLGFCFAVRVLQDEIVPAVQMTALHAAATRSSAKELLVVADGHHNDTWQRGGQEYIQRFRRFIETYAKPGAAAANLQLPKASL